MAPKFTIKIAIAFLVLALCIPALVTPVSAASSIDISTYKDHVIKFYLDPALAADMEYAKIVLPKYVADMNTILGKNTARRLVFDPETGIVVTSTKPHTDSAKPPLPTQGFEIWAYAVQTDRAASYGGYAGMDISGAGVLADLRWTRVYDPENLDETNIFDYSIQLNNMLHELAHVFGAGIGEYYNLANITDTTNTAPLLNIKLSDPQDPFWSDKRDFIADPLLRLTRANTRSEYLDAVRYSDLTAAVINGDYRNGIPSLDHYTVLVLDENGQPMPEANIKVWGVYNTSELLFDGLTDENGQVALAWGGSGYPHNASNFLRLIKVYKDNISLTQPKYISIFDVDRAELVSQNNTYIVTFKQDQPQPEPDNNKTEIFNSTDSLDGWILESSEASNKGGKMNSATTTFNLGDASGNKQYRAILHFDTSSLPDDAVITNATLKIKKQGQSGTNPFTILGSLRVDMRNTSFGTPALALSDFNSVAGKNNVATFEKTPMRSWYSAILNDDGRVYMNRTGTTQFRLYFTKDDNNDNGNDFIKFYSGNAGMANRPQLIIEYYVP